MSGSPLAPPRQPSRVLDLRLVVPAAAAWAAAALASGGAPRSAAVGSVAALMAACAAAAARRPVLVAACLGAGVGAAAMAVHVHALRSGPVARLAGSPGTVHVVMTLTRDPQARRSSTGRSFVLADATVRALGGRGARDPVLVIGHGGGWTELLPGQRVRMLARVLPARPADSVAGVLIARSPPVPMGRPPMWQRLAGRVRRSFRTACSGLPADERGLVTGLVDGDVAMLPPVLSSDFQIAGLTHLTAVSGENCAIVLGAAGVLLARLGIRRRWRPWLAAAVLALFVVLARPSPSVLRAGVMGVIALAGVASGRRPQALPALAAAVLLLVAVDPFLARDPGFALSVLATAAILLLAPGWTRRLAHHLPLPVAAAIAVPAAAQLACTPVLVVVFGQLSPLAVPANLLAAPAVAPTTVAGIVAAVLAPVAMPLASLLAWVAALPAAWLALVARTVAGLPGAGLSWPRGAPGLVLLGLTTAAFALGVAGVRRRSARAMLGA